MPKRPKSDAPEPGEIVFTTIGGEEVPAIVTRVVDGDVWATVFVDEVGGAARHLLTTWRRGPFRTAS